MRSTRSEMRAYAFPDRGFWVRMMYIRTQTRGRKRSAREHPQKPCTGEESARVGQVLCADDEAIRTQNLTSDKTLKFHFEPGAKDTEKESKLVT